MTANYIPKFKPGDIINYRGCGYLIDNVTINFGPAGVTLYEARIMRTLRQIKHEPLCAVNLVAADIDMDAVLIESFEDRINNQNIKEENQMNIEHKKKPETKIKTNLEMIREMDSERLAQFLTLHGYQLEPDSKPVTAEVEKWLNNYIVDPESACAVLNKLITDDPAVISKSDMTAVVSLAIKYIEGAELLKKEVAELSGISTKAAKLIQGLVAQYLP